MDETAERRIKTTKTKKLYIHMQLQLLVKHSCRRNIIERTAATPGCGSAQRAYDTKRGDKVKQHGDFANSVNNLSSTEEM